MDRLDGAHTMDGQYHGAKLTAAAFNDPARIWEEHERFRGYVLSEPTASATDDLMAAGAALFQRAHALGHIPPPRGAN